MRLLALPVVVSSLLVAASGCNSDDGVTPQCTDAGECFTAPGDASPGNLDAGDEGTADDAASTDETTPAGDAGDAATTDAPDDTTAGDAADDAADAPAE